MEPVVSSAPSQEVFNGTVSRSLVELAEGAGRAL